jgi:hypothetical protein
LASRLFQLKIQRRRRSRMRCSGLYTFLRNSHVSGEAPPLDHMWRRRGRACAFGARARWGESRSVRDIREPSRHFEHLGKKITWGAGLGSLLMNSISRKRKKTSLLYGYLHIPRNKECINCIRIWDCISFKSAEA